LEKIEGIKKYEYKYDKVGNIIEDGENKYKYDDLYQIKEAEYKGKKEEFEYDKM